MKRTRKFEVTFTAHSSRLSVRDKRTGNLVVEIEKAPGGMTITPFEKLELEVRQGQAKFVLPKK